MSRSGSSSLSYVSSWPQLRRRLGFLAKALRPFTLAALPFEAGIVGPETTSAADFCRVGLALSNFVPPLLMASATDSTTTVVAAAAAAPNAVPATVFTASAALLIELFFRHAHCPRAVRFHNFNDGLLFGAPSLPRHRAQPEGPLSSLAGLRAARWEMCIPWGEHYGLNGDHIIGCASTATDRGPSRHAPPGSARRASSSWAMVANVA